MDYKVSTICDIASRTWENRNELASESWLSINDEARRPSAKSTKSVACFFHSLGIGGGERVTRIWVNLWQSMGLNVTILTNEPTFDSDYIDPLPEGVHHVVLPNSEELTADSYPNRCEALEQALLDNQVDTLILCHWFFKTLPFDVMLAKYLGIKVFLFIQSSFSLFFLDKDLPHSYVDTPLSYPLVDGIICLSEMDRIFWSNFNDNTYRTFNPTTIEVPKRAEDLAPLNGHTVIWPARLHPDKLPERVLPILKSLLTLVPDTQMIMVGPVDDSTKAKLLASAENLGIADHLAITGPQSEADMKQWYRSADAYLLTSEREGWSLALGEALSLGLPCVIYELPYLTLASCKAVQAVPQGDSGKAADALAKVLTDKQYAHELAIEGNQFMQSIAAYDYKKFWNDVFSSTDNQKQPVRNDTNEDSDARDLVWRELFRTYRVNIENRENAQISVLGALESARKSNFLLEQRIKELEDELRAVRSSHSFRLGLSLTAFPRKIRELLQDKHGWM